jgi:hypothetical protein
MLKVFGLVLFAELAYGIFLFSEPLKNAIALGDYAVLVAYFSFFLAYKNKYWRMAVSFLCLSQIIENILVLVIRDGLALYALIIIRSINIVLIIASIIYFIIFYRSWTRSI